LWVQTDKLPPFDGDLDGGSLPKKEGEDKTLPAFGNKKRIFLPIFLDFP